MKLEASGKNVEIAIQNGLLECGMKREEVEVKVLEEGGLFKKARVELSWGEEKETEPEIVETEVEEAVAETSEKPETAQPAETEPAKAEKPKRVVDTARLEQAGKEFLLGLVKLIDENATVDSTAEENQVNFSISGEGVSKLIGYHGENLQALQQLVYGLKTRAEGPIRVFVDVDGYKQNRNQNIIDLANRTADQAVKIERNIHLDPMNAYERRIVHTTLQEREDVTTESTGEGEKRHVVVKPVFKR